MKLLVKCMLIGLLIGGIIYFYVYHDEVEYDTSHVQQVEVQRESGVEYIDLNTYLIGVVASEMSPTYEIEALKAQCVAARTFVTQRDFKVDDSTNTQVFQDASQLKKAWGASYSKYYQRIKEVVLACEDEILTYDGQVISALFYAQSCGKTANADEYFGSYIPYLVSVDSSSDKQEADFQDVVEVDIETLMQQLQLDEPPYQIQTPLYYESGYVKSWEINGMIYTGREIREALSLRSSSFEVKWDERTFYFTTKGYGHGVGMSQRGANAMAKEGYTYQQILAHYYPGTEIMKQTYK